MPIAAQFAASPGLALQRVPDATLPQLACDILTKTPGYAVGRGALGAVLARVAAWEAIVGRALPFCRAGGDCGEQPQERRGQSVPHRPVLNRGAAA